MDGYSSPNGHPSDRNVNLGTTNTMDMTDPVMGANVNVNLDSPSQLNMELVHDFGEGVGVDMRDFNTNDKDDLDPELATPQLQTSAGMSSQPPTSIMTSVGGGLHHHHNNHHHHANVNVAIGGTDDDMFQAETGLDDDDDDDDEDGPKKRVKAGGETPGGFTFSDKDGEAGRRKIRIEYISDKSRRHITFSKRKAGIMKKAYELSILTGTQILLLVVSETGLVYTFTTTKLQPLVSKAEGKNLIQACLNAPDGYGPDGQPLSGPVPTSKSKNGGLAIRPHKLTAAASAALAASAQAAGSQAHAHGGGGGDQSQPQSANDQQTDAGMAVGMGAPGQNQGQTTPSRPKKRLPSGKKKNATTPVAPGPGGAGSDGIPPVPPLPDMHHQGASPHTLNLALASPISTNYTYPHSAHHPPPPPHHAHPHHPHPHEYGHPHHQQHPHHPGHPGHPGPSPTQPTFYTPGPAEYGPYGYAPQPPPHQQQQQQQQQQQWPGMSPAGLQSPYGAAQGHGHSPHQPGRDGERRMMGMNM